jgi:hypothetical protein
MARKISIAERTTDLRFCEAPDNGEAEFSAKIAVAQQSSCP